MIEYEMLKEYSQQYQCLDCSQPLKITAKFASSPAGYDFPHLDNILAKAIVQEATQGKGLPASDEPYWLPLPLAYVWRHPESYLPLWASTDFLPIDENEKEAAYWHKRTIHARCLRRKKGKPVNIRGTEGKDKEYRSPLPRNTATTWIASCQGNMEEIGRLLCLLQAIGKKPTQGHGAILSFTLQQIAEFSFVSGGKAQRPIPFGLFGLRGNTYLQGWTPPYWLPATHCQAYPTGSIIKQQKND